MSRIGLAVSAHHIRGIVVVAERLHWVGEAGYDGPGDLADVLARLAAEAPAGVRRVHVVLERDVAQTRTLLPSPFARTALARRYVALDAARLFRTAASVTTDATIVRNADGERALWSAAAGTETIAAVERGCREAGLVLEDIGCAADVLPVAAQLPPAHSGCVAYPNGTRTELLDLTRGRVWRSRHVPGVDAAPPAWREPLDSLGPRAKDFAAAYAASRANGVLSLFGEDTRRARTRRRRFRILLRGTIAAALAVVALAIHVGRIVRADASAREHLAELQPRLGAALRARADLARATDILRRIAASRATRSNRLGTLALLATAAGDPLVLVSMTSTTDSIVRIAGYTPVAARLESTLEQLPGVRDVRQDIAPSREAVPGKPGHVWDRFAFTLSVRP